MKQAYVTLLSTNDHLDGVVMLNNGLRRNNSTIELICIIDKTITNETRELLEANGISFIEYPLLELPENVVKHNTKLGFGVWNGVMQKLHVFNMTDYDKIVYLDADLYILENIDELFSFPDMSFVQDPAVTFDIPDWNMFTRINAGVMVLKPDRQRFEDLWELVLTKTDVELTDDIKGIVCDQSIIDEYLVEQVPLTKGRRKKTDFSLIDAKYNVFLPYIDKYEVEPHIIHLAGSTKVKLFTPTFDRTTTKHYTDKMYKYASMYFTHYDEIPKELKYRKRELSIIIPHYKESEEMLGRLLQDLDSQRGVDMRDIEIVVVEDDPETEFSLEFYNLFTNLRITQLKMSKNGGPGIARQAGIDFCRGEYVMFVDSDDRIHTALSIHRALQFVRENRGIDIFTFRIMQESEKDGVQSYLPIDSDTHLHSKIYRKAFLAHNNIKFLPQLRLNEDSYFNGVAFNLTNRIMRVPEILTIWCHNPNSLTKSTNTLIHTNGYVDYIKGRFYLMEFLRPLIPRRNFIVNALHYLCFFFFNAQTDKSIAVGDLDEANKLIWQFMNTYRKEYIDGQGQLFKESYVKLRKSVNQGNFVDKETFHDFYDRMENIYGKYAEMDSNE